MNAEQQKKIRWLERAFYAEKLAKAYLEKCEREKSLAQRLSRCSEGTAGTSSLNPTEDALIRLAVTERQTQEKLKDLVKIREEISEAIQQIQELADRIAKEEITNTALAITPLTAAKPEHMTRADSVWSSAI